jgi:hypothetical protein
MRAALPWLLGALAVVAGVALWLWWTAPPDNLLPEVYSVL